MFDDPYDIDCARCGADLDNECVSERGRKVPFHVERRDAARQWNELMKKKGELEISPEALQRAGERP